MEESQVTNKWPDGWAKRWILSNSDMPVAKRSQWGWLVGWLVGFYGISTFVGYLMPNPFSWKEFYFKQFILE